MYSASDHVPVIEPSVHMATDPELISDQTSVSERGRRMQSQVMLQETAPSDDGRDEVSERVIGIHNAKENLEV